VTARLARAAVVLDPGRTAMLTDLAAGGDGGYDYSSAWNSLYTAATTAARGLELTFILLGVVAVAPLAFRRLAAARLGAGCSWRGCLAGSWPWHHEVPRRRTRQLGRTVFETMSGCFTCSAADLAGRVAGLALTHRPGVIAAATVPRSGHRRSGASRPPHELCRRHRAVRAVLYWEHVDALAAVHHDVRRVLGVKILIFGTCWRSAPPTSSGCTRGSTRCGPR